MDVVDENNELTGETASRSEVHSKGLWHRTVHIYVFRKKGDTLEFLVQLRSASKSSSPNCWDTKFGGHVKAGSSFDETIAEEIEEEIGIKYDASRIIGGFLKKGSWGTNQEFSRSYFFECDKNEKEFSFNDGEVQCVRWMSIEEIKKSMLDGLEKWTGSSNGFIKASDYLLKKMTNQPKP